MIQNTLRLLHATIKVRSPLQCVWTLQTQAQTHTHNHNHNHNHKRTNLRPAATQDKRALERFLLALSARPGLSAAVDGVREFVDRRAAAAAREAVVRGKREQRRKRRARKKRNKLIDSMLQQSATFMKVGNALRTLLRVRMCVCVRVCVGVGVTAYFTFAEWLRPCFTRPLTCADHGDGQQ